MASMPSYPKHVTSTSARTFVGWGVNLFPMYDFNSSATGSLGKTISFQTSGLLKLCQPSSHYMSRRGYVTHVMESLNASIEWPYFLFSGHAMASYSVSIGVRVFSATCLMMEWTILPLLYRSSHLMMSSGETRRFERSI